MSFFWIVLSSIVEKYGSNSVAALIGTIGCVGLLFFIALNKPFDKWLKGLDGEYETETLIFPDHSGRGKHWFDGQVKDGTPWEGYEFDTDDNGNARAIAQYRKGVRTPTNWDEPTAF